MRKFGKGLLHELKLEDVMIADYNKAILPPATVRFLEEDTEGLENDSKTSSGSAAFFKVIVNLQRSPFARNGISEDPADSVGSRLAFDSFSLNSLGFRQNFALNFGAQQSQAISALEWSDSWTSHTDGDQSLVDKFFTSNMKTSIV
jgi:hypothetical protein